MRHRINVAMLAIGVFVVLATLILQGCTATTKVMCPSLSPPPGSIVTALENASRQDPDGAAWTIGLERHYQKLDACQ